MTDKKLTDEEIVKALECCVKAPFCSDKTDCPYKGVEDCVKRHTLDAIDLINRLQEENERLRNAYKQCAWERDIFAEDMKEEIKKDCSYLMLDIKTIKAEAYKEFAERLKFIMYPSVKLECKDIDNLLKELVGEDNA